MYGSVVCGYYTTVARHSSSLRPFTALLCHKAHIRLLIFLLGSLLLGTVGAQRCARLIL